jgi:hypothetical protein
MLKGPVVIWDEGQAVGQGRVKVRVENGRNVVRLDFGNPLSGAKNGNIRKQPKAPFRFLSPETGVRIPVAVLQM